ncbi:MAG: hypothetical protein QXY87_09235 [Saccharolobus sp.]|uniref:hypothetical protein n=1 Tax=Saccharolobus TaxID=2100760 RepID=UPI001F0D84CF|nr:hypothetical protein [Saccharolobus shibatae]MCH4815857.1 hypothetical protein [Saccharolobus shibatae]
MEKKNSINISLLENLVHFFSIREIKKGELRVNAEIINYLLEQGLLRQIERNFIIDELLKFIILKYNNIVKLKIFKDYSVKTQSIYILLMIVDENYNKIPFYDYIAHSGLVKIKKKRIVRSVIKNGKKITNSNQSEIHLMKYQKNKIKAEIILDQIKSGEIIEFGLYIWNRLSNLNFMGDKTFSQNYFWIYAPTLEYSSKIFLENSLNAESINLERFLYLDDSHQIKAPIKNQYILIKEKNHIEIKMHYLDYGIYKLSYNL